MKRRHKKWLFKKKVNFADVCEGKLQEEYLAVAHRWESPNVSDIKWPREAVHRGPPEYTVVYLTVTNVEATMLAV